MGTEHLSPIPITKFPIRRAAHLRAHRPGIQEIAYRDLHSSLFTMCHRPVPYVECMTHDCTITNLWGTEPGRPCDEVLALFPFHIESNIGSCREGIKTYPEAIPVVWLCDDCLSSRIAKNKTNRSRRGGCRS